MSDEEDAPGGDQEPAADGDGPEQSPAGAGSGGGLDEASRTPGHPPEAGGEAPAGSPDGSAADRTTERRTLSPRVQLVWGLRMLAGVAVLTFGAAYAGAAIDAVPTWAGAAVGLALLLLGVVWVHLRYRVWAYEVRADSLYLERGVLTHVRTIAPFVRIQHVDTQRGPLERWLGLSTLVVYTAGTRGADVSIPGLTPAEARDLQARVKELAIRAEGGDAV